ncbi:hypothetical protein LOY97_000961 [Ophidiomyces ophidiicola]|nr:hypothetical protein LOZ49_002847 [Ophidiomyces ophidiicola]KAI2024431.1 hypothetical protein LOZ46_001122 [Ophidiomyces ophidiicola]KAI2129692.1 hypothetical protein LOZ29_005995 [Ophidiomyces ophidiicola]KAI2145195.1 hypothetical protein LOZ28_001259 [Ophidiomyces ophidiicola]KAI2223978.1 hypothetical protein LOZ15_000855 [Ophidiomyces ophidiicola]
MKVSTVIPASLLVATALAQDLGPIFRLPACPRNCIFSTLGKSGQFGCRGNDVRCLCASAGYHQELRRCASACSPDERNLLNNVGRRLCQEAGVPVPPHFLAAVANRELAIDGLLHERSIDIGPAPTVCDASIQTNHPQDIPVAPSAWASLPVITTTVADATLPMELASSETFVSLPIETQTEVTIAHTPANSEAFSELSVSTPIETDAPGITIPAEPTKGEFSVVTSAEVSIAAEPTNSQLPVTVPTQTDSSLTMSAKPTGGELSVVTSGPEVTVSIEPPQTMSTSMIGSITPDVSVPIAPMETKTPQALVSNDAMGIRTNFPVLVAGIFAAFL